MTKFVTRNDIAIWLEVSVDRVRKNEKRWGLDAALETPRLNARSTRYHRSHAVMILATMIENKKPQALQPGVNVIK